MLQRCYAVVEPGRSADDQPADLRPVLREAFASEHGEHGFDGSPGEDLRFGNDPGALLTTKIARTVIAGELHT